MSRIECWANIPNKAERKAVMAWVRAGDFFSFSEIGEKVTVIYESDPNGPNGSSKCWGVIHFFEQYSEHSIFCTDLRKEAVQ